MSHYSEQYEAYEREAMLKRWGPDKLPPLTAENLRFNIARANKAEQELKEMRAALKTLQGLLR